MAEKKNPRLVLTNAVNSLAHEMASTLSLVRSVIRLERQNSFGNDAAVSEWAKFDTEEAIRKISLINEKISVLNILLNDNENLLKNLPSPALGGLSNNFGFHMKNRRFLGNSKTVSIFSAQDLEKVERELEELLSKISELQKSLAALANK